MLAIPRASQLREAPGQAGADTFRREGKLRENLEKARAVVEQMGDPEAEITGRQRAARRRAVCERA